MKIAKALTPWCAGAAVILLAIGTYMALFVSPKDYQQGDTVRIMFIHVPSAWMALGVYSSVAVSSAIALIWRHPVADLIAKGSAPVGAGFTLICLVTGSLWGQPMWGTWWVWDARLTSMLVLFFLYIGYIAMWHAFEDPARATKPAAILALVGFVNVPIIKFSVDWWNTLHQPASVVKMGGPAIHSSILTPLLVIASGFVAYTAYVVLVRAQTEIMERKIRSIRMAQVQQAAK